jgi:2-iminobutanoate/2-iminopropanoate deaminase
MVRNPEAVLPFKEILDSIGALRSKLRCTNRQDWLPYQQMPRWDCNAQRAGLASRDIFFLRGHRDCCSMTIKKIQPAPLFQRALDGHVLYSHVVVASGESLVFVSGQLARDKSGSIVGPKDMRTQIKQVGENLRSALEAAGATLDDLVKTTTFVTDIDEFFKHVDVRHDYLGVSLPASTTVEVRRLSHPDLMVEIEAIALLKL